MPRGEVCSSFAGPAIVEPNSASTSLLMLGAAWLLLPAWLTSTLATPDSNYTRIVASGSLRTCLDPSFPPFEVTGTSVAEL